MKQKVVEWFKKNYPDLHNQMIASDHTHSNGRKNPYHMEGDVFVHSMMVLDLAKDDINHIFAALLHDIGKVSTRHEKRDGKVAFRYHENVSMFKSIDILNHAKTEFNVDILLVLKLIAWHGTLWSRNKEPITNKLKTFDACYGHQPEFLKELIEFVQADAYGRDYADTVQTELDFLDTQFEYLQNYVPYNTQTFKPKRNLDAVFLIGVSGSGKSTYLDKNPLDDCKVVSVDNYFYSKHMGYDSVDYDKNIKKAHDASMQELLTAVESRKNIVIDMTNLSAETRGKKLVKIPTTQYNHKAVVFLKGEKTTMANLKKRDHKQLSEEIINKQITQFELPNFDEFDSIEYIFTN
jgi:predicted kinase